jgi:hypothetical protein
MVSESSIRPAERQPAPTRREVEPRREDRRVEEERNEERRRSEESEEIAVA